MRCSKARGTDRPTPPRATLMSRTLSVSEKLARNVVRRHQASANNAGGKMERQLPVFSWYASCNHHRLPMTGATLRNTGLWQLRAAAGGDATSADLAISMRAVTWWSESHPIHSLFGYLHSHNILKAIPRQAGRDAETGIETMAHLLHLNSFSSFASALSTSYTFRCWLCVKRLQDCCSRSDQQVEGREGLAH